MRGTDLLDKMELTDAAFVEEADKAQKKRRPLGWIAAACLCVAVGAAALIHFSGQAADPLPDGIVLSERTTAKVTVGCDADNTAMQRFELLHLTEEEMFADKEMYIFRGRVSGLTNLTIDFNGTKEVRCLATMVVEEVYQGAISEGETVKMLLPCPIMGDSNILIEDTGIISHIESGMEGIFMARVYDENSYWEEFGATLFLTDLAPCGLGDGMRWAFLDTEHGLVFERNSYGGAANATTLDDIEEYVKKMLG